MKSMKDDIPTSIERISSNMLDAGSVIQDPGSRISVLEEVLDQVLHQVLDLRIYAGRKSEFWERVGLIWASHEIARPAQICGGREYLCPAPGRSVPWSGLAPPAGSRPRRQSAGRPNPPADSRPRRKNVGRLRPRRIPDPGGKRRSAKPPSELPTQAEKRWSGSPPGGRGAPSELPKTATSVTIRAGVAPNRPQNRTG